MEVWTVLKWELKVFILSVCVTLTVSSSAIWLKISLSHLVKCENKLSKLALINHPLLKSIRMGFTVFTRPLVSHQGKNTQAAAKQQTQVPHAAQEPTFRPDFVVVTPATGIWHLPPTQMKASS